VLLVFSVSLGLLLSWYQIKEFYKINSPQIIEAGKAIQRIVPEDELVIAPYNGDTAFLYQTKRYGWPVIDRPLEELIEKGAHYLVTVNLNDERMIKLQSEFKIVEKTDQYVILDLQNKK
jgi:hypothetical protein